MTETEDQQFFRDFGMTKKQASENLTRAYFMESDEKILVKIYEEFLEEGYTEAEARKATYNKYWNEKD